MAANVDQTAPATPALASEVLGEQASSRDSP